MSSEVQIKIFDYRNACYQGQALEHVPNGLGSVLTQDFLFCMSIWDKGNLHGPCICVFPSQKIFYGQFINNNPDNLICYELSKECQIYCIYKAGKTNKHIAAHFPYIKCVLEVQLGDNDIIQQQKEHDYQSNADKWNILQNIFRMEVPQYMRGLTRFVNYFFTTRYRQIQEIYGSQYFFGMVGEGLGVKINLAEAFIQSIGYYDQDKVLKLIGKRTINREKRVKQEGIYERPQTLVRYQERPPELKKKYRDYFRLAIDFQNKFIHLHKLEQIQKQMMNLRTIMIQNTTNRIAQQLIEHLEEVSLEQKFEKFEQKPVNRSRFDRAIPMGDVSMDQLRDQLNRSKSHKKTKETGSPYKKYNPEPAELKYASKTGKKNEVFNSTGYEKDRDRNQSYDKGKYEGRRQRDQDNKTEYPSTQPKYRDMIRNLNYDNVKPFKYQVQESEPRRYPIEENLRTNNRNNTSKSPIKLQHRPVLRYQYVDEQINPEKKQPSFNYRVPQKNYGHYQPERSVTPDRGLSPNGKTRLDRLSNLYDEIQAKNKQPLYPGQTQKKYTLNRGKGYQFDEYQQFDEKMGLVKAGRRVQSPKRNISSTSPLKVEPKYPQRPAYYETKDRYQYKFEVDGKYDQYERDNRYDNSDYPRRQERERKVNYGYFDKNR